MATIFITMSALCVRPPAFTPRQLIRVKVASAVVATTQSRTCKPVRSRKYRAKVIDTAAIPPALMTSSNTHP